MPSPVRFLSLSESTIPDPRRLFLFVLRSSLVLLIKVTRKLPASMPQQYRNPKAQSLALSLFRVDIFPQPEPGLLEHTGPVLYFVLHQLHLKGYSGPGMLSPPARVCWVPRDGCVYGGGTCYAEDGADTCTLFTTGEVVSQSLYGRIRP